MNAWETEHEVQLENRVLFPLAIIFFLHSIPKNTVITVYDKDILKI